MRKFYFYITILIILTGCSPSNTVKEMESSRTITDIFDKAEIKDLAVIVDFFNGQIGATKKNEKTTITQCYQRFFEWMKECEVTGLIDVRIPYREQQKMYSQLSDSTFNQLWRIDHRWFRSVRNEADTIETKEFVYIGKYLKFLEEYGKENSVVERCYNNLVQLGDYIPVPCMGLIMSEYEQLDVKDVRTQLFIAMHFLTLNDGAEDSNKFDRNRDTPYKSYYYGTLPKASKELKE